MTRYVIGIGLLVLALMGGAGLYLIFQGPRMRVQQNVRAFQAVTPVPPAGSLPRNARPSLAELARRSELRNPLADTRENRAAGKVYYGYYCAFCHGETGDGSAPVGDSYMPAPPSLRRAKLGNLADRELLLAMLTGTGHDPVLDRIVPPRHRWPLLLYVRNLSSKEANESRR